MSLSDIKPGECFLASVGDDKIKPWLLYAPFGEFRKCIQADGHHIADFHEDTNVLFPMTAEEE